MELNEIVERIASLIPEVDEGMTREHVPTTAKGRSDIPSVGSAGEKMFLRRIMETWAENHPNELPGIMVEKASRECPEGCLERPYIEGVYNRGRADVGITTDTFDSSEDIEWIIEIKKFVAVGESGGKHVGQEASVAKILSPWPMTSGILHDSMRILTHPEGSRKAVVMYGFSYDESVVEAARQHPRNEEEMMPNRSCNRAENLNGILNDNNNIVINFLELIPDFERTCDARGIRLGERCHSHFEDLTTHPINIQGDIVAWEILDSEEE